MLIDTHAHVYPDTYLDEMERAGVDPGTIKVARNLRASDEPTEMQARLGMMAAAGVDMQVLSVTPQLPTTIEDPAAAARLVKMGNDLYARLVKRYPGKFMAYGAMPLPHVDESLEALCYCLDTLGFQGMAANSIIGDANHSERNTYPGDARLDPVYAELDRRHAVLYFHPTGCGACSPMINGAGLEWVTGAPVEDQLTILHLLRADIPARYPHIRLHVAHLGGDIPFLVQRIQDNFEDWGAFKHSPREDLRKIWVDAANFHGPSLRMALEVYGKDKVMCGSDYPYFQGAKYTRAVTYIRDALSEDDAASVLSGNARRLYGI